MTTLAAAMARAAPGASGIPAGTVARAEVAAAEVVRRAQPTEDSERRRAGVIDYARRLVGAALGCEVFAFGSVPLKTYLPDGDIDLTVLGNTSYHSTLIDDVYCILQSEELNSDAEFEVKDSQHINAEVRLIKCTIENIIVDISFNQTGGICALCFLELVDRRVGKNHLFKRSIILIKAWCYYESRLLGAHHGLISTYALEILVLYIFNLFHKSLHGPLEVLYRFLEYFSKFDWDNYCISLNGPVALSSLPNLIVEATNTHDDDLLFDKEFLRSSVDKAFVPPRDSNAFYTKFRVKHLNIIDPLKEHNNLGRSVNRASFNRIRTAFSYGARKLGQILMLSPELIPDEIYGFFKNTLKRNGRGVRPDIGNGGYASAFYCQPFPGPGKALLEEISNMKISYKKEDENRSPRHLSKSQAYKYSNIKTNGPAHAGGCFPGDHKVASSTDLSTKSPCFVHHAPKQYSSFYQENGNGVGEQYYMDHEMQAQVSCCTAEAFHVDDRSLMRQRVHVNNSSHTLNSSTHANTLELAKHGPTNKNNFSVTVTHLEKHHLPPFSSLSLPDLSGDLASQLRCLRQVQYHLEYLFDGFLQSVQEASSDDKVDKDSFKIPTLSILLNTDVTLPRLLSPSSAETDGRKSSPVSSYSTEDVSQQSQDEDHWDMASQQNASGTDAPSNGLSPSSSYADSESSVSWCHSLEDIPNMHGTGPYIPEKHMASLEEKGKTLIDQPVKIKNNQASVPKGSFVTYKQQVALESGAKEITTSPSLKVQDSVYGCIRSDRKLIEKQSCDTQKECVKPDNEARQIPRYYGDARSNKNLFQKRNYDTHMEFLQPPIAMKQMPKHEPLEVQDTPNKGTYINNLARKQSYDTRKGHEILYHPTEHVPIPYPLKLQSSLRGRLRSNKNSAAKQNYGNHKEHLSFVRDAEHVPSSQALSILNGSKGEVQSNNDLVENGSKPRLLSPKEPLSACNTCQLSFPVMKGYSQSGSLETPPDETIEFGSLGPFSLTFFSSKPNKAPNTHTTSKACADSPASVLQSYRAGATQTRSPGLHKVGDEDHFPPLHAGTR